jgi:hypothetical protein
MSQPNVYKTATLTATGSAQNLLAALLALDPSIQGSYREVNLQGDPANTTNNVLIGDDQLSTSRLGVALAAGASRNYREGIMAAVPIANMFFLASAGSPKLNVELIM